jgi:hypothetical protein
MTLIFKAFAEVLSEAFFQLLFCLFDIASTCIWRVVRISENIHQRRAAGKQATGLSRSCPGVRQSSRH